MKNSLIIRGTDMRAATLQVASTRRSLRTIQLALLVAAGVLALAGCDDLAAANPDQISQAAVDRADLFLGSPRHAKDILGYVHFGATYRQHTYLRTVTRGGGSFALIYRYNWEDDGVTDVAFNCDRSGLIESVQIEDSNAVWSPPFGLANMAIKVLGNALLSAFNDDMTESDRRQVQRLVDQANAKSLLEWSLRCQQHPTE